MTNRRNMLAQLAAGAAAIPAVALGAASQEKHGAHHDNPDPGKNRDCVHPGGGPYAEYFPNVVVHTHDGQKALFYHDLLRGKTVLLNCMSVKNEAKYPVTANLIKVQQLLGERLGRAVFMYSLTVDPENDTPRVLRAFAEKHKVRPGWFFLSAKLEDVQLLRGRLFAHDAAHSLGSAVVRDCSMGLVRYGNEAVGLWGSVPAKADPEWIVKRLSWVESRPATPAVMTFKRRGPIGQAPANHRSQDLSKRS
jgi:protein SCO1/2